MIEISNNSLSTFRTCPKKWWWHYIERLKPRRKSAALYIGYAIHEAFDMLYKNKPKIIEFIDDLYKRTISSAPPEEQERLGIDYKTVLGMFINSPYKTINFQAMESEKEFEVKLTPIIKFIGRVDGLVKDNERWWIREIKTTGMPTKIFEQRAQSSSQATGYIYALKEVTGLNIQGVMYDYIRKPRLYKRRDECGAEYGQRIYADYCNKEKQRSYYSRYYTYRSPYEIQLWKDDTLKQSKHITRCIKDDSFYRNTSACWVYGSECPYKKICFSETIDPLVVELFYEKKDKNALQNRSMGKTSKEKK